MTLDMLSVLLYGDLIFTKLVLVKHTHLFIRVIGSLPTHSGCHEMMSHGTGKIKATHIPTSYYSSAKTGVTLTTSQVLFDFLRKDMNYKNRDDKYQDSDDGYDKQTHGHDVLQMNAMLDELKYEMIHENNSDSIIEYLVSLK